MKISSSENASALAREWFILLNSGESTDNDRLNFESWLNASPVHRQAFEQTVAMWNAVGLSDKILEWDLDFNQSAKITLNDNSPLEVDHRSQRSENRSRMIQMAAGVLLFFFLGIGILSQFPEQAAPERHASGIGQLKEIVLVDGSVITLAGDSAVRVEFINSQRRIFLEYGLAYFDVAHDPSRPFFVATEKTEVRVLGTRFSVRGGTGRVEVAVEEGRVEVAAVAESQEHAQKGARILISGEKISTSANGDYTSAIEPMDPSVDMTWLKGRYVYDGAVLERVIEDMNRNRQKKIKIVDENIRELEVTTSFEADETDRVLSGLVSAYSLKLTDKPSIIELEGTPASFP